MHLRRHIYARDILKYHLEVTMQTSRLLVLGAIGAVLGTAMQAQEQVETVTKKASGPTFTQTPLLCVPEDEPDWPTVLRVGSD